MAAGCFAINFFCITTYKDEYPSRLSSRGIYKFRGIELHELKFILYITYVIQASIASTNAGLHISNTGYMYGHGILKRAFYNEFI